MKKVYVVGTAKHYADFITNIKHVDNIEEADIVIFTGGEDVYPSLYHEEKHPTTYSNLNRDLYERDKFEHIKPNQLVVGICRGSQFLCVMNGGKLVQNVSNHGVYGTHPIMGLDNDMTYEITSTHHQMQYPFNLDPKDYDLLYIADRRSITYEGGGINRAELVINGEPEIVLYHKANMPKCLAIQGHPEYMRKDAPVVKMLNNLINNTLKTLK
jgi:gamma-glutamyl-gamma-aminobutyrate hydrolase PuuD